jgi:peroxiredoxin
MILLRDRRPELEALGVASYGISRDSPYSHVAWREVLDLDFPLLSDWNGDAVRAFGVAERYKGLADAPVRSAFLVDAEGIIRGAWRYEASEVPSFDELLAAARAL